MKSAVFWYVTSCGSCMNRRFGRTYRLHHEARENKRARNVSTNVVPSSPILFTLIMKAMRSSDTSDRARATRRQIPEDGYLRHDFTTALLNDSKVAVSMLLAAQEQCRLTN
jgi:hypothetical protein